MPTDMYRGMQAVGGRVTRGVGGIFSSDDHNPPPAFGAAADGGVNGAVVGGVGGVNGADDGLAAAAGEGEDDASARVSPRHRRTRSGGGAMARTRTSGGNSVEGLGSQPSLPSAVDGSAQRTKAKEIVVLLEVFRKGPGRYHIFVVSTHRVMCCEGGQGDTYKVGR